MLGLASVILKLWVAIGSAKRNEEMFVAVIDNLNHYSIGDVWMLEDNRQPADCAHDSPPFCPVDYRVCGSHCLAQCQHHVARVG